MVVGSVRQVERGWEIGRYLSYFAAANRECKVALTAQLSLSCCSAFLLFTSRAKSRWMADPFQRRPSDQPTGNAIPSRHGVAAPVGNGEKRHCRGSVLIDARPLHDASAAHLIPDFNKRREGRDSLGANAGHPLQLFHRIEGPLSNNGRGLARTDAGECGE